VLDGVIPPAEDGGPVRLLGSRCGCCGEVFFPARAICTNCSAQRGEPWEFGPEGVLYTYTVVREPPGLPPRAFGQVDFEGKVRVQGRILGDFASIRIGTRMKLVLRSNADGLPAGFAFRPSENEGASGVG